MSSLNCVFLKSDKMTSWLEMCQKVAIQCQQNVSQNQAQFNSTYSHRYKNTLSFIQAWHLSRGSS